MATTLTDAYNAIRAKWQTLAGANAWTTIWDNAPNQRIPNGIYARFSLLSGEWTQMTLGASGSRRFRHTGIAQATIFVPIEQGEDEITQALDNIRAAFQAVTESSITYRTPTHQSLGLDGRHFAVAVSIPFWVDEVA